MWVVRDRMTNEPADTESGWMLDFCVREGRLFEKGSYYYNRVQLIPSLVIEKRSSTGRSTSWTGP